MKIKKYILPIGGIALGACGVVPEKTHPNVLYVFPDQFRNCAMSFWNDAEYSSAHGWIADPSVTPNLNAFAGESVVLSNAMSSCPLSSPYRGMFLTGMYPERSGIMSNCMAERPNNTLRKDAECISDVFSTNGYSCGYIGKFHAEVPMKNDPANPGHYVSERRPEWDAYTPKERRHGFDYWYSYGTFDEHKNPHYWDTEGKKHTPKEFSVKHEVDKAIEYLRNENGEREKNKPFFLCVAFNPPHSPYSGPEDCISDDYSLYADKKLKDLYVRDNADTTLAKAPSIRYYLSNVTTVDREFGRLLSELKKLGLDKNTIVVFTADHGETMCSHSTPDPKNSIWTESFNVPFMVRYPKVLSHKIEPLMLTPVDIMPTLLSLSGLENKIPKTVEGKDYSAVLKGKSEKRPEAVLYIRNINGKKDSDSLVRNFFPVARGIKTNEYTMEIVIDRKYRLKSINIFNDISDPYQMHRIIPEDNLELFDSLCVLLQKKLKESNDIWYREGIMQKLSHSFPRRR